MIIIHNIYTELIIYFQLRIHSKRYFFVLSSKAVSVPTCCHILSVMGDIAAHLNEDTKDRIISK